MKLSRYLYDTSSWSFLFILTAIVTFGSTYCISLYRHDITMRNFTLSQSINKSNDGSTVAMRTGQFGITLTATLLLLMEVSRKQSHFFPRMSCVAIIAALMISVAFSPLYTSSDRHFNLAAILFVMIVCYTVMYAMITKNPLIYCLLIAQVVALVSMFYSKRNGDWTMFSVTEITASTLMLVLVAILADPYFMHQEIGSFTATGRALITGKSSGCNTDRGWYNTI
tara:strand:- start:2106 stop:2780 length:675 start_codon:yes stop_codon:yes gene_type:complete